MATVPQGDGKADIGRVLSKGFGALTKNFLPFFGIAFVLAGAPAFLSYYLMWSGVGSGGADYILSGGFWGTLAAFGFGTFLASMLLQGVLLRSTILHLSGRNADIGASVVHGLKLILPIIGVSICVGVLIALGLIALVVPGIMVYCASILAVAVLVEERQGVFASISRSWELTSGSRWGIFLLVILLAVISSTISGIGTQIAGTNIDVTTGQLPNPWLAGAVEAVTGSLTAVLSAVLLGALYVELREVKEGVTADDLAGVFS